MNINKEKFKNKSTTSIPENWTETTLGEVCEKIGDGLHGTPRYSEDGEYFFINGNNIVNGKIEIKQDTKKVDQVEFDKYKKDLNERTILLSINGTIGNLAKYRGERCILGKSAAYLNIKKDVSTDFIYYLMFENKFQYDILKNANGSTIKNVGLAQLRNYSFFLPPLPEQQAIAQVLSSFDDKIELLREENKILEELGQTIFKEWFGKYNINDELPEDWRIGKLGEELVIKQGRYLEAENLSEFRTEQRKYPIYGANGIRGYIDTYTYETPKVVFGCRGLCGNPRLSEKRSSITNTCMALENEKSFLSSEFIYFLSKKIDFESVTSGSAQPQITVTNLYNLEIVIPNHKILQRFDEMIYPIFTKIRNNLEQIQSLARTRDELLPKMMNGEVRVEKFTRN